MDALTGIARAAGTIAARWVEQGRYATVEEAIEPAIVALVDGLDAVGSDLPARAVRAYDVIHAG